ncbi:hypothetical protein QWJ34_18670 [Saccharibacillus sp. CPCC 101409]|uniref:hypothetical protein n=1 Tax=Saccharibacillus sp. CPCC 101409 TaxID=3058041 RepID=UPI002673DB76|nr:hypothetical protein [Saccharibacillus sp. CPCC 101409]MDO3411792.1 hypothetical protein [Saccharibacillus sp. CPCC 101409]
MNKSLWKKAGLWSGVLLMAMIAPGAASAEATGGSQMQKTGSYIQAQAPFQIKITDAETGRGIPLVQLRTTNNIIYYTDSAGVVAFDEPGLMNRSVFFHLSSDGYQVDADMFGNRGQAVDTVPGGSVTLTMNRVNIAERLYRITGQGIYRDSVLLGLNTPIQEPLINGLVMGQDSVQTIPYNGKLYWFWGDTDRPAYPLGNFRVSGATSELPANGGLDPDVGVDLDYFTQPDGFVKSLVPALPDGANIAWVFGLMTAEDDSGQERLLAGYSTHNPDLSAFGILAFNDQTEEFEQVVQFPDKNDWRHPGGQATYYEEGGQGYWLFTEHHMPNLRVAADYDAIIDYTQYEAFTPLTPGTTYNGAQTSLERDASGSLVWGWKKNTPPLTQEQEKELIGLGVIGSGDARYFQLKDADTGAEVRIATSDIEWNDYRQRYTMIGQQIQGTTSVLGEIWYAEADAPQGPWTTAKKIATHDNYTFYNVAQHEFFNKDDGRVIYFEGTYTNTFTDHVPTPRYNYNQVMYKLELDNPDLELTAAPGNSGQ